MELYFVDLLGISFCSLMFYIYLRITKQTEQQLGFIALYCFAYSAIAAVSSFFIKDDSFLKELLTCSFFILFVVFYPIVMKHKLGKKEINLLIFISTVGILPFLFRWLVVFIFTIFNPNMQYDYHNFLNTDNRILVSWTFPSEKKHFAIFH